MPQFRTEEELKAAHWARKYQSVAEGRQYDDSKESPFPVHEYLQNRLLGPKVKMLEVNAGAALIDHLVADTVTEMNIQVGDGQDTDEQTIREWMEEIGFRQKLEEAVRDYFGNGFSAMQPIRTDDNFVTVGCVSPDTFYPTLPTFTYEEVSEIRLISDFEEENTWYAFEERHTAGLVEYFLYSLDHQDALEGKQINLSYFERFADLPKQVDTDLELPAVFFRNRQKSSRHLLGRPVLYPIWDILQEVTEVQTQIRHERIKHLKSKMYAPVSSLKRAQNSETVDQINFKTVAKLYGTFYDMNQDLFPISDGSTVVPGYVQRSLESIDKGITLIDSLLSKAAAIAGCPRSIFNLDEKGEIHVETEKRKDRRYMRQVYQAQQAAGSLVTDLLRAWWIWTNGGEVPNLKVTFADPFELGMEEKVKLMREMNPDAVFISRKEALKRLYPEMKPEERDELLREIEAEEPKTDFALNRPVPVEL